MQIFQDVNLKPYNSFGFSVKSSFLVTVNNLDDAQKAFLFAAQQNLPYLIIGGGSNLVFTEDFNGVIIKLNSFKITQINARQIEVDGGVIWHDLVIWSLEHNLYGLENLALIPGTVGAAPVQNIGAYGAEFANVCHQITALEITSGQVCKLLAQDCAFSYRNSIFKKNHGKWLILQVTLNLQSTFAPNLSYTPLKNHFTEDKKITAQDVFNKVCELRASKLPNPQFLGNVGSFFHNPLISNDQALKLQQQYPHAPLYPQSNGGYKIAAGWLIEQCNFKGLRMGDAGVHHNQALVLVNYGSATGKDIVALSATIQAQVLEAFDIELTIEPLII